MFARSKQRRGMFFTALFVLTLVVTPSLALADDTSVTVVSPDAAQARTGQTYGTWSATWWQYVLSHPAKGNPLLDTTGSQCQLDQSGPVFFLMGSVTGLPTVRNCQLPGGRYLLFPLVNEVDVNTTNQTAAELYLEISPIVDTASQLYARVDGQPVEIKSKYRTLADPFSVALPKGNLLGLKAGTYYPAVADGYWLMLAPLRAGPHTLEFGGTLDLISFQQNVTYYLTVGT